MPSFLQAVLSPKAYRVLHRAFDLSTLCCTEEPRVLMSAVPRPQRPFLLYVVRISPPPHQTTSEQAALPPCNEDIVGFVEQGFLSAAVQWPRYAYLVTVVLRQCL